MTDDRLEAFNLVGGTALALKLGHRKSIDLDLFSTKAFSPVEIAEYMQQEFDAVFKRQTEEAVYLFVSGVKVDMIYDPDPLIDKVEKNEGIRMPSLRDIGALKLSAIYDNGKRLKDFVDLYRLLENHPLETYLDYARRKFPDFYPAMLKLSVLYHDDVNLKAKIEYLGNEPAWPQITERLREAFYHPGKIFSPADSLRHEQRIRRAPRKGKGLRPG